MRTTINEERFNKIKDTLGSRTVSQAMQRHKLSETTIRRIGRANSYTEFRNARRILTAPVAVVMTDKEIEDALSELSYTPRRKPQTKWERFLDWLGF